MEVAHDRRWGARCNNKRCHPSPLFDVLPLNIGKERLQRSSEKIKGTRLSMDVAFLVVASFGLPIVAKIEANVFMVIMAVFAVVMASSMSCAKVIAGTVVVAT